jgi:hypothetical protein
MSGDKYSKAMNTYETSQNIPSSMYTLEIDDAYGDGICCSEGAGSYSVTLNDEVVASGGKFNNKETQTWGSCKTTETPPVTTTSPTNTPSMVPSSSPSSCEVSYEITLNTGPGSATSWEITYGEERSNIVASSNQEYEAQSNYVEVGCLDYNYYSFTMSDSSGLGMKGGSYSLKVDGIEIASGGEHQFQFSEVSLFGTCKPVDP